MYVRAKDLRKVGLFCLRLKGNLTQSTCKCPDPSNNENYKTQFEINHFCVMSINFVPFESHITS